MGEVNRWKKKWGKRDQIAVLNLIQCHRKHSGNMNALA